MLKKEIIAPAALGRTNPSLSPATKFGNLVFVSGQTGRNPSTGEIGADVREQTRNVMERIKIVLEDAGTTMDNVLSATCWLKDAGDFAAFNEEYDKYFPGSKPARATVQATLMGAGLVVEVMVIACIPD
jgi:2-iminobutanoate/2-iminopropanoate deaminase